MFQLFAIEDLALLLKIKIAVFRVSKQKQNECKIYDSKDSLPIDHVYILDKEESKQFKWLMPLCLKQYLFDCIHIRWKYVCGVIFYIEKFKFAQIFCFFQ